jgi:hypothetical protein
MSNVDSIELGGMTAADTVFLIIGIAAYASLFGIILWTAYTARKKAQAR